MNLRHLRAISLLHALLANIIGWLVRLYKLHVVRDPFTRAHRRWVKDRGDETLRLDYPLSPDSLVLDVGGYRGEWTHRIVERYDPFVLIIEPVPTYAKWLRKRFHDNPKVEVFDFALAEKDDVAEFTLLEDGSSLFRNGGTRITVRCRDVVAFLAERGIGRIDLMKVNIEGGEYPLLDRMLDADLCRCCRDLQIQFHDIFPGAGSWRQGIRERLAQTHALTYDYEFVWENWCLRG